MTAVEFEVVGTPTPQGSKTRMPNGAMIEGRSAGQRSMHRSWRSAVAEAARDVADGAEPLTGPLSLAVEFRFAMPKSRKAAVRAAGRAPKVSAPDLDKLVRSVGDALAEGGLIGDDALFCELHATKTEVIGWTGAIISVREWVA
jgi:Holliday junction resolvase RusA-like endonuclease